MFQKILIYFFLFLSLSLPAQVNISFFNYDIPQSNFLNPANIPSCKLIIGIPFINGAGVYAYHNGFVFNDLFERSGNSYSLTTNSINNTLNKTAGRNYFLAGAEISDLFIGYKYNNVYFNISVRERVMSGLFYNKDLLRLGLEGNTSFEGETASLQGTGLLFNYFRQYSFGVAVNKYDYFKWGTHLNLLFGKANTSTLIKNTGLFTNEETFALSLDARGGFNASLPYVLLYNANGDLSSEDRSEGIVPFLLEKQNKGISVDAGFIYEYSPSVTLHGSITDLGFIRYRKNTSVFRATGEFNYNGPDENDVFEQTYLRELINTLDDSIDVSLSDEKYTFYLPPDLYAGIRYNDGSIISYEVLYHSVLFRNKFKQSVTLQSDIELGKHVDAMISWSLAHRTLKNAGVGLSFDFYPVNLYIISDNIMGFIWPRSTKNVNLQFGLNLKFGCHEKVSEEGCNCSWIKAPKSYQKLLDKSRTR